MKDDWIILQLSRPWSPSVKDRLKTWKGWKGALKYHRLRLELWSVPRRIELVVAVSVLSALMNTLINNKSSLRQKRSLRLENDILIGYIFMAFDLLHALQHFACLYLFALTIISHFFIQNDLPEPLEIPQITRTRQESEDQSNVNYSVRFIFDWQYRVVNFFWSFDGLAYRV